MNRPHLLDLQPPVAADPVRAAGFLDDLIEAADAKCMGDTLRTALAGDGWMTRVAVEGMIDGAPYLRHLMKRAPSVFADVKTGTPEAVLERAASVLKAAIAEATDEAAAMSALRHFKDHLALTVALADLSGRWGVREVVTALSDGADLTVQLAVAWLWGEAVKAGELGGPEVKGYTVLAMGKHGARELNYSSDIDLIVFFDPERAPFTGKGEVQRTFIRITQGVVRLLQNRTPDGYVFRVDLRLRPDPGSTPVAIHADAALNYYEAFGQNWERAAMIKARPIAGDFELGEDILKSLRPFIWRKHLDYASIADVHAMKRQIHAVKGHGRITIAGHDVKLGRGGIREIEFFVQTQQLIGGGKNPGLRMRRTIEALEALSAVGWITGDACDDLTHAYNALRAVEHRLQMLRDEQTQTLPPDGEALDAFAKFCGHTDPAVFRERLKSTFECVQDHYAALFETAPSLANDTGDLVLTGVEPDPSTVETFARHGFSNPEDVIKTIQRWHHGKVPAMRTTKAREILTELMPALIDAIEATDNADAAFIAFDRFMGRLPTGIQLFSLLKANPRLLSLLMTILGTAPRLSKVLMRRPSLLDSVLDPRFFADQPTGANLAKALDRSLADAASYEEALDLARMVGHEQDFRLGVRLLTKTLSPADAGKAYADLADLMIRRLLKTAWYELAKTHGEVRGGAAAILAMGRLGGREMTAGSDLDLILIYDHEEGARESDGERPLSPAHYFTRLTQRLVAALSAQTARGSLYEVDMRLRPSGRAGPLATHIESFAGYQRERAWIWEHMALTRARVVCGDPELKDQIEAVIGEVLSRERERGKLFSEVREMRAKIAAAHKPKGIWDLKHVEGGLVDIEFVAEALVLAGGAKAGATAQRIADALQRLAEAGMLESKTAGELIVTADLYQSLIQLLRLALDDGQTPDNAPDSLKRLLVSTAQARDFEGLTACLKDRQARVHAVFEEILSN